jgi:hypothetical protein
MENEHGRLPQRAIGARSGTGRQLLVEDQAFPLRAPIAR